MSSITTHILDTTHGKPAEGVSVILYRPHRKEWTEIGRGITSADGRMSGLLPHGTVLPSGMYRLRFETGAYFDRVGHGYLLSIR